MSLSNPPKDQSKEDSTLDERLDALCLAAQEDHEFDKWQWQSEQVKTAIQSIKNYCQEQVREKDKQIIILRSDLAYAIGGFQGLGHPSKYLEKRYPELSKAIKGE